MGNPIVNGEDTIYPCIPAFKFLNQDSIEITDKTFEGKIYVADFIFLSCPSICPKMTVEMSKVYDAYKSNPNILFISHTIDPEKDSVKRLKRYADNIGADSKKWFFVTGNRDSIYSIAENAYFTSTYADSSAPGGFVHGGGLVLIDRNKHIRGVYDGTNPRETNRLKTDIKEILTE